MNALRWTVSHALPSGVLAEQINPFTGEPVSVSPLTWSHAAVVQTVMDYLEKLQELHTCGQCGRSIFRYDRAGRQQVRKHSPTHSGIISDQEHIHYLEQVNVKKDTESFTVSIDQRKCIGCGICVENAEGAIDVVDDKAKIIAEKASTWHIKPEFEKCCPLGAITVKTI